MRTSKSVFFLKSELLKSSLTEINMDQKKQIIKKTDQEIDLVNSL